MSNRRPTVVLCILLFAMIPTFLAAQTEYASTTVSAGWLLQDQTEVHEPAQTISATSFKPHGWFHATVPGTILTTLVNNHIYPEPLYGENDRPDRIPESLNKHSYWYRTVTSIPVSFKGHHIWLNFEGINYSAQIWVNGRQVGTMQGAFVRGAFDISQFALPGANAAVAVLVSPQPHPGTPHQRTIAAGMGSSGGVATMDGPTFFSTLGWDWLPAIADRDTGIWQKVYLSASGPVLIKNPFVTTDLPLPKTDTADVEISATLDNITDSPESGTLTASFSDVQLEQQIQLEPHSSLLVRFDPRTFPALHLRNPRLWWPNGYGDPNLYSLQLSFRSAATTSVPSEMSDTKSLAFGIRKFTYFVPNSTSLTISVNGVPILIRGGNWGLDEALKRIPCQRLEAEVKMHKMANLNLIRNWVGQSTSEDFYDLCDRYGILVWDEFSQPNPADGPNPDDLQTYIANVEEKVLRFRNYPSILLWCARNESAPPRQIDDKLRLLMPRIDPTRRYQLSSDSGRVNINRPFLFTGVFCAVSGFALLYSLAAILIHSILSPNKTRRGRFS